MKVTEASFPQVVFTYQLRVSERDSKILFPFSFKLSVKSLKNIFAVSSDFERREGKKRDRKTRLLIKTSLYHADITKKENG